MQLSQITIPALSQSSAETMACPRSYVAQSIDGKRGTDSIESERGTEVHDVMSQYIDYCAQHQVEADWPAFDRIAKAVGPVAGPILQKQRDSYRVNWQRVYGTEIALAVTEDLKPCHDTYERGSTQAIPTVVYHPGPAAHHGKMDVVYIAEEGDRAMIEDFKSHPQPFEPDTYQGLLYPLMLFVHLPTLQRITFRLRFVRYENNFRDKVWERSDIPEMATRLRQARERQRALHENPDEAKALPCKVCTYCPLARDLTCPIADYNEYTVMSPSDRLRAIEFYARMKKLHMPVLKAFVEVHGAGSVTYTDGNGATYSYQHHDTASTRYPLDDTSIQALRDHAEATGENLLNGRLNISSTKLKGLLKTNKRSALRQLFEDSIIETETKPKWKTVRSDPDAALDEYEQQEEEENGY